jgi:phytoene dehydrogenase-like protein
VPTAEILAPFPYEAVAAYGANKWRRRGAEYDELKKAIGDAMLDHVEKRFPGFRKLVTYREMSTPITNEFFTGHRRGAVYGYPAVPERFDRAYLQARTPLPGLFLTGADALSFGVMGAMMGGVTTAAIQLGPCGMREIMTAVRAGTS